MTSKAFGLAQLGNAYSDGALSNRNKIINGAMTIDQRNAGAAFTSLTTGGAYTLDRWTAILTGAADKFSVQKNAGGVTPPAGFSSYLGVTSLSAYSVAAGDFFQIKQNVEGFNTADLSYGTAAAKDITVSFWVRSSLTGNFGLVISWGSSNANQRAYPVLYAISAANTWEYKTITIPGDTTMPAGGFETGSGSGVQLRFSLGGGATNAGTPGAWATANHQTVVGDTSVVATDGATWQVTGVQLEAGDTATPFEHRSYGQELARCQRYYIKLGGENAADIYGAGYITSSGFILNTLTLPVKMRTSPTGTKVGTWTVTNVLQPQILHLSTTTFVLFASGTVIGQAVYYNPASTGYLTFDAEL